jgi:hypothetical protein
VPTAATGQVAATSHEQDPAITPADAHDPVQEPASAGNGGFAVESRDTSRDMRWALGWLAGVIVGATSLLVVLLGPLHIASGGPGQAAAVLAFVGVLVTATASVIGLTVTRQSSRAAESRLRLDAAMRAGESFSSPTPGSVSSASIASSLLALTKLDNIDLAVALLVDFWLPGVDQRISDEAAILVVDAALRSRRPNAQLVAAEVLCRNSMQLDACQSTHWPSYIDGRWDSEFGPKTRLLLIDALTRMAIAKDPVNEHALRSVAVRLYGIFVGETNPETRGCVAMLIAALIPSLVSLEYDDFMQGNQKVMLSNLVSAANHAKRNPDDFLARMAEQRAAELAEWAEPCTKGAVERAHSALAATTTNPTP